MIRVLENNIYKDPLTGLSNFFKLMESDVYENFGKNGTIIIFDFKNFENFNEKYGRDKGDLCLKNLTDSLKMALVNVDSYVYRTDGDEFTVIIPHENFSNESEIILSVKEEYKKRMKKQELNIADISVLTLNYLERINSVEEFYNIVFRNSIEQINAEGKNCDKELLLMNIIGNFTRRIKETLAFYNDAFNLALTDDISGLSNQRAANLYLSKLIKKYEKSNKEFSLLFIDGDNLKRYNRISYQSGNDMIRELASIVSLAIRSNDKVFRWLTGDEFLVILDGANYENAMEVAERIRHTVEERTRNSVYPVTVSIGISNFPNDGTDIEKVIGEAEKANISAKNRGKNNIVMARSISENI